MSALQLTSPRMFGLHKHPTLRRLVRTVLIAVVLYIVALNSAVRRFGGAPHLLSFSHTSDKSLALLRLTLHKVRHVWSSACEDPTSYVRAAAREEHLPEAFVLAIARMESGIRSHVISATGAMGVMQLMPSTAARFGVWDPFNPESNARGGARYIATLWRRYHGDRKRVAAAYNAGEGAVPTTGPLRVSAETLSYAKSVVQYARTESDLRKRDVSATSDTKAKQQ